MRGCQIKSHSALTVHLDPGDGMQEEPLASTDGSDMNKVVYVEDVSTPLDLFTVYTMRKWNTCSLEANQVKMQITIQIWALSHFQNVLFLGHLLICLSSFIFQKPGIHHQFKFFQVFCFHSCFIPTKILSTQPKSYLVFIIFLLRNSNVLKKNCNKAPKDFKPE